MISASLNFRFAIFLLPPKAPNHISSWASFRGAGTICERPAVEAGTQRDQATAHLSGPSDARHRAQSRSERPGVEPAIIPSAGTRESQLSAATRGPAQALQHAGAGSGVHRQRKGAQEVRVRL